MNKHGGIGIDVGGTKTLCILVDSDFEVVEEIKFKTAPTKGCKRYTRKLTEALNSLSKKAAQKKISVLAAGVGCAGVIDEDKNTCKKSPNIPCIEGFCFGKLIQRVFGAPTAMGNDVHMGLYGEHTLGAGKGYKDIIGIFFGTGVGGALMLNGRLHRGSTGTAGQIGRLLTYAAGEAELVQDHAMLDRVASKASIGGAAIGLAMKNHAPYLYKHAGSDLAKFSWDKLADAIKHGDEAVEKIIRARMRTVGITLSNVVNFIGPELVLLGGGLMESLPELVSKEIEGGLREHLEPEVANLLKVKVGKLDGRAVALGALKYAFDVFGINSGPRRNGKMRHSREANSVISGA